MYSGTTLRHNSGNLLGAHQKIDRFARKQLLALTPLAKTFPTIKDILHFEGNNGPDGIKRKSPGKDEPWHHYDPLQPVKDELITLINNHEYNLTQALATDNYERASFEAAWLAHALVDGLTPAHHYPLEAKIEELWGYPKDERLTFKQKNIISGKNPRDTLSKNWQYWGAKGVWTTHFMFEWGFATTVMPLKNITSMPTPEDIALLNKEGIEGYFKQAAAQVYELGMYETFYKNGWTQHLARQTKEILMPLIVKTVSLSWYNAVIKADMLQSRKAR